jgi:transcriptional regulator with XRE-family HTH domain
VDTQLHRESGVGEAPGGHPLVQRHPHTVRHTHGIVQHFLYGSRSGQGGYRAAYSHMTRLHRRLARDAPIHHLRSWRKARRLTQEKLAERADLSHSTISRLESGEMDLTRESAAKLAAALYIEIPDLFRDPNDPSGSWSLARRISLLPPAQRVVIEKIITAMSSEDGPKLSNGNA